MWLLDCVFFLMDCVMFLGNGEYHFARTKSLHHLSLGYTQHNLWKTSHRCTLKCKLLSMTTKVVVIALEYFAWFYIGCGRSSIITGKLGVFSEVYSICSVE